MANRTEQLEQLLHLIDLDMHPLQYGTGTIGGGTRNFTMYNTEDNDDPTITERYNRCPTCEQWSPCSIRSLVEELRAEKATEG